jgi:hypothetical protein
MSVTLREFKEMVRHCLYADIPIWGIGPPGVGKSEAARQVAAEEKIGFIDLRVAQLDPVDVRGLPAIKDGKTTWNAPDLWPDEEVDGKFGIILADELADSSRAMQSAMYQPILDHMVGKYPILKGWYIMAASNDRAHKAGAQAISSALANRFAWAEIEANWKVWDEDYAGPHGLHHYVRAFLKMFQKHLFSMEGADLRAFPTPRAWARLGRTVKRWDGTPYCVMEQSQDIMTKLVRANVGDGVTAELVAFLRAWNLPGLEDVVKAPLQCPIPTEPSSRYAMSCMLSRGLTIKNIDRVSRYIQRPEFGTEFEVVVMTDGSRRDPALCETKSYNDFGLRNKDVHL